MRSMQAVTRSSLVSSPRAMRWAAWVVVRSVRLGLVKGVFPSMCAGASARRLAASYD